MFIPFTGSNPVTLLKVKEKAQASVRTSTGELRKRTARDEKFRLIRKYGDNKVAGKQTIDDMFPGEMAGTMPETFADAGFDEDQPWQAPSKNEGVNNQMGKTSDEDFAFMSLPDGASSIDELARVTD